MRNLMRTAVLIIALFAICSIPAQAVIYWSNSSGSADNFDWENGHSLYGLFGDPILVGGSTLTFYPQNFRADSNGQPTTISDTLVFDLIAHTNILITGIEITEYGDYGILGDGSVDVTSNLQAQNLDTLQTESANLITTPTMPVYSGMDDWNAAGDLQFDGWTHLRITLCNDLLAISEPGSVAFIQKKIVGDAVAITIIPEPATIAVLAAGLICLKRKKH